MADKTPKIYEDLSIEGMGSEGKGFAKVNGKVIFTEFAVPGDVADIEGRKKRKRFGEGKIKVLKKASGLRTQPACKHFGVCGGCKWQHIQYPEQLHFKKQIVQD